MIHKLKNISVRDLVGALEQDGFQYRKRKGSQRVYRILTEGALLFTTIIPRIPNLLGLFKTFSKEHVGLKTI